MDTSLTCPCGLKKRVSALRLPRRLMSRCELVVFLWIATLFASPAHAISITTALTDLGSNSYRYDYTVTNDGSLGSGVSLGLFDLWFDPALYDETSLTPVSSSAVMNDWLETILASAPGGVPALYDVSALGTGLAVGKSLSGFAVQFTWLGTSAPPLTQAFDVYDPATFVLLETGTTISNTPVPEPATVGLVALGALGLLRRRQRPQDPHRQRHTA
ncbi:exported hypothetical protein [Candidatus Competibacter denitrificans Run_A_D11]|jgi:hypothetical protein|uniref:Ice-binding protein C-terminal domain-containing protein n=1 Tax=Candidatus Competibacter denitrificans Run_A_D11 TaxID=1400863 RepID=W6MEC9_9GAMM|nr:PEP-CTERM sorting domain-containing protein [Candidatus Competibacter denitrificans]CDI04393.1 exported hypothetical protein [Candidatus Competibacter denitrificans Run_A_D11]HAS86859.1 PEP-CTERM sorting domain-containing protein [Candidatus Competibacteraceae bacterium]HRC70614.1 PEP-CTERM sorting domain-containing protein [Candidatus Competibacter denitrificans]